MVSGLDTPGREGGLGAHLRAFVLGRVTPASRVAVVGKEDGLTQALSAMRCPLWTGSVADQEALPRFAPTHVVLAGNLDDGGLEAHLSGIHALAPEAELLVGFVNAGAASALLATLMDGASARQGPSDAGFRRILSECGLRAVHREARTRAVPSSTLAAGTERALLQFLAQIAPGAADDVLLYAVARAPADTLPVGREPGLLSIVLWNGPEHRHLLDEAVFSIACQRYRPFEIVLVEPKDSAAASGDAVRMLETYRRIEDFRFQYVSGPPGGLMDEAIRRSRGQYLAFFESSGLVYPGHFEKLVQALREGEAAWAVSRAFRRVSRSVPGGEEYIETKIPFPLGDHLELAHFREHPWLLNVFVIDRERIASFPLRMADPAPGMASALPLRLAAVFEPLFLNGLSTCEQRKPETTPAALEPGTEALRVLRSLHALEQAVVRAREAGQGAKGLRHRALDELNARLQRWAPWVHRALRSTAARWLK